jgi:DNA-directed RNA polymerase specialized sigma24 family protein
MNERLGISLEVLARCPTDERAWEELYRASRPFLIAFLCRAKGLSLAFAVEVADVALLKLVERVLPQSVRHNSGVRDFLTRMSQSPNEFHSWLKRVASNAAIDAMRTNAHFTHLDSASFSQIADPRGAAAIENVIAFQDDVKTMSLILDRLLAGAHPNQDAIVLREIANGRGCQTDAEFFVWLISFLAPSKDESIEDRRAVISEFVKRQHVSRTAAEVRFHRLRQRLLRLGDQIR